ncbi:MAG TPA: hypothetical protein PLL14_09380 [Accumulibacter sp.]|nr:hypothetical protein [Accumulibacter sp.]
MNAKTIVENVLTPARARDLWTVNYFPALPFTPQHFEVGGLLPAMLYMARWGYRRGKGRFIETFGPKDAQSKARPPRLIDVIQGLLTRAGDAFYGFDGQNGPAMLADLLLTYCLENKSHELGHQEVVQRVFPTHYLASWVDLPETVAHLRGVPELLTVVLAWQDKGEALAPETGRSRFPVGVGFANNRLLAQFGRHMSVRGLAANQAADHFQEETADDLGVDELLAIRLAQTCSHAPDRLRGSEQSQIANRWPVAKTAAKHLRGDLAIFIEVFGVALPRQAFLPMLEAGISLGMVNLLLSSAVCLSEWERTGSIPKDPTPMPLFVDCSHGLDNKLRNASEAAMGEALARYERLPVLMMLARVLDDRARFDRILRNSLPSASPDPTARIDLLGEVYHERHNRATGLLNGLEEDCLRLADALESEASDLARALRTDTMNPALRLAEALVELHGHKQQGSKFTEALDSSLMPNRPNGLAFKRRVSRNEAGTKKAVDLRSIVLSHALLDFLVHRHLRKEGEGKAARPLTLRRFLDILREHYGLYVDREPPGMSVPQDLLRANKQWLERRLRDLGLLVGVNDAESMKQLRARFDVA